MKATIVDQPGLRLITAKSERFPEGNGAAFLALESELESLKGRKFYGLIFQGAEGLDYHAGMVPLDGEEERRFAERGFPTLEIAGGPCARVKLMDWKDKLEEIGPIMGALIEVHGIDSGRPQMEFYRSESELQLLMPIPRSAGKVTE